MNNITIIETETKYAASYNNALNSVAGEQKFLCNDKERLFSESESYIRKIIDNNWIQYLALDNDLVVGWCDIIPYCGSLRKHVGVLGMGIIEKYRSQGIGSQLIKKAIAKAKEIKLEKIELEVFSMNNNAVNFYYKNGFTEEGERINSVKICNKYDNLLCMGRFLT